LVFQVLPKLSGFTEKMSMSVNGEVIPNKHKGLGYGFSLDVSLGTNY